MSNSRALTRDGFFLFIFKDAEGRVHHFLVHSSVFRSGFGQRNRNNFICPKGSHSSELAAVNHVDRAQSISGGEHPVECRWRTAALNVTKNNRASFIAGAPFKF